jgi:RNA polymerase primary sigma factor
MKRLAGEMEILIKKKHRLKLACRPGQVSHQAECPPANDEEDLIDGQMASPSADGETEPPVHDFAAGILEMLFAQEQQVVRMRFGIGFPCSHTLEEIGQAMHLTRERIRQIEAKVLQRLSDPERARRLRALMAAR